MEGVGTCPYEAYQSERTQPSYFYESECKKKGSVIRTQDVFFNFESQIWIYEGKIYLNHTFESKIIVEFESRSIWALPSPDYTQPYSVLFRVLGTYNFFSLSDLYFTDFSLFSLASI